MRFCNFQLQNVHARKPTCLLLVSKDTLIIKAVYKKGASMLTLCTNENQYKLGKMDFSTIFAGIYCCHGVFDNIFF